MGLVNRAHAIPAKLSHEPEFAQLMNDGGLRNVIPANEPARRIQLLITLINGLFVGRPVRFIGCRRHDAWSQLSATAEPNTQRIRSTRQV